MRAILLSFLAVILVLGLGVDASAQKKRKKAKQPLPMPTPVQNVEPAVVSRATDYADLEDFLPRNDTAPQTIPANPTGDPTVLPTTAPSSDSTVEELARQVRELTGKIDSMDTKQKMLLDLQILSSAEQRSENLRRQLLDSTDKEGAIKTRLEQIDYDIRPEVIERKAAFIGSLRPEEVRENMRKTLQSEKDRLTSQLTQIQNNRAGLEASIASADSMAQRLRAKLEKEIEEQLQAAPAKKPE